jgi:F-type H+-transporting ATPase subunit delta
MARPETAARRYAEAAFEVALAADELDRWQADLRTTAAILGRQDVERVVDNPAMPVEKRLDIVRALLEDRVSAGLLRLVALLVERGRVRLLPRVSDEFTRLLNAERGIVTATVTSAVPLTPDEEAAVRARAEALAGGDVELRTAVDPELLGGITLRIGDRLLDASIRGRLERLRAELHAGARPR